MTVASARPATLVSRLERSGVSLAMAKGALWSMGGNAAGMATSFFVQVLLARSLAATNYGMYAYLVAWVNVAVLVGKLEFDTAAVRFVGAYDGQHRDGLLRGFLGYGFRMVGRMATVVGLFAGLAAWLLRRHLPAGVDAGEIWAAAAMVPLTALMMFSGSVLQGFRRIPQSQLPSLLLRPLLFGAGVLLIGPTLGHSIDVGGAVALNAVATAVALSVSLFLVARAVPPNAATAAREFETPVWTRAVRGFLVIATAQLVLSQQADILVIGSLLGARDAGLYSVASQLATLIGFAATAIVFVVLPVVSSLHAQGRRDELQRLVVRIVQGCAAVSIPITAGLFLAGHLVLGWYGPEFEDARLLMMILSGAQLFHATIGIISGFLLTMTGHEWEASRVIVGTALLNLALVFALTPLLGAAGAALATAIAGMVKLALLWRYARRFVGIRVLPYMPATAQAEGSA